MRVGSLVTLLCLSAAAASMGCQDTDQDRFSAAGTYKGPASVIGTSGGTPVVSAEDDTVVVTDSTVSVASDCVLQLADADSIGVNDHDDNNSNNKDVVREIGQVKTVIPGQTCTLPTSTGNGVTFVVSDGVVTSWRASPTGSMEASLTGSIASGGSVTYWFSGAQ